MPGSLEAAEKVVGRSGEPVVGLVRNRLSVAVRRVLNEEDTALSALETFIRRV